MSIKSRTSVLNSSGRLDDSGLYRHMCFMAHPTTPLSASDKNANVTAGLKCAPEWTIRMMAAPIPAPISMRRTASLR